MNGVIYARYSSDRQNPASIEQQVRECQEYADRQDIKIIKVYADRAITGKTDKRPEFQRMMRDAQQNRFSAVVTYKVDRFARNREDSAIYKGRLRRLGIRVIYAKETMPEGPEGILLESVMEGLAEYYSANLSQNVKRGMYDNAVKGKVNSGGIPYGYKRGQDDKYAIDEKQMEVVKEIFDLYNAGVQTVQIVNILNGRGLHTKHNKPFQKSSITTMLQNERYIGTYKFGELRVENGCPAIITKELFQAVNAKLNKHRQAPAASRSDVDFLLTGKLFCGLCGHNMIGDSGTGRNGQSHYYYACTHRKRDKICKKKSVHKEWIESFVIDNTLAMLATPGFAEKVADAVMEFQEKEKSQSRLFDMQDQLKEIERSLANVMKAIESGIITQTTKERMEELELQKSDLTLSIEAEKLSKIVLGREQVIYWIEKFRIGDKSDFIFKTQLIEAFVNAIYLYDDKVKIAFNFASFSEETISFADIEGATVGTKCFDFGRINSPCLRLSKSRGSIELQAPLSVKGRGSYDIRSRLADRVLRPA